MFVRLPSAGGSKSLLLAVGCVDDLEPGHVLHKVTQRYRGKMKVNKEVVSEKLEESNTHTKHTHINTQTHTHTHTEHRNKH